MFKRITCGLIAIMFLFVTTACTMPEMLIGVNALATQQRLSDNMKEASSDYPEVVKIISSHSFVFTKEELDSLKSLDKLFSYAQYRLNTFRMAGDVEMVEDFKGLYSDLELVWKTVSFSYNKNADIIKAHEKDFTPEEYFKIVRFDRNLKIMNTDIDSLINKANKSNPDFLQIVEDALMMTGMAITIYGAVNGDRDSVIKTSEMLSTN